MHFLAYTLKGVVSAIGADVLAKKASALEDAAREATTNGDTAPLEELERALCDALTRLTEA